MAQTTTMNLATQLYDTLNVKLDESYLYSGPELLVAFHPLLEARQTFPLLQQWVRKLHVFRQPPNKKVTADVYVVPYHISMDLPASELAATQNSLDMDMCIITISGLDYLLATGSLPSFGVDHPLFFPLVFGGGKLPAHVKLGLVAPRAPMTIPTQYGLAALVHGPDAYRGVLGSPQSSIDSCNLLVLLPGSWQEAYPPDSAYVMTDEDREDVMAALDRGVPVVSHLWLLRLFCSKDTIPPNKFVLAPDRVQKILKNVGRESASEPFMEWDPLEFWENVPSTSLLYHKGSKTKAIAATTSKLTRQAEIDDAAKLIHLVGNWGLLFGVPVNLDDPSPLNLPLQNILQFNSAGPDVRAVAARFAHLLRPFVCHELYKDHVTALRLLPHSEYGVSSQSNMFVSLVEDSDNAVRGRVKSFTRGEFGTLDIIIPELEKNKGFNYHAKYGAFDIFVVVGGNDLAILTHFVRSSKGRPWTLTLAMPKDAKDPPFAPGDIVHVKHHLCFMKNAAELDIGLKRFSSTTPELFLHQMFSPGYTIPSPNDTGVDELNAKYPSINRPQARAIVDALSDREGFVLIQGPPGSGKTNTICTMVTELLKQRRASGNSTGTKILVCAPSHAAVDHASRELSRIAADPGPRVFSLIQPSRVALEEVFPSLKSTTASAIERETEGAKKGFEKAEIICTTLAASCHTLVTSCKFDIIIVDEAAHASFPLLFLPLLLKPKKLIMVGDHMQLPHTVMSGGGKKGDYRQTLFKHLVDRGHHAHLLDVQYRMHPEISVLSSQLVYDGRVKDASHLMAARSLGPWNDFPRWHKSPFLGPAVFINVPAEESEEEMVGTSFTNDSERDAVLNLLRLINKYADPLHMPTIAVLCMYKKQSEHIQSGYAAEMGATEKQGGAKVTFSTVDSFHGQERDIVILSCSRTRTEKSNLDFLANATRNNVALTRARYSVIVVASAEVLLSDQMRGTLLYYFVQGQRKGLAKPEPDEEGDDEDGERDGERAGMRAGERAKKRAGRWMEFSWYHEEADKMRLPLADE